MKSSLSAKQQRIAMLIDGDNAQASMLDKMIVETTKYGVASVRRIYGDWTDQSMNGWKKVLNGHAIQPIQQFRYTAGKNATDSALIIDAMDLLHSKRVDSFCIVSSDSDYTRLATRIREEGMFVIGMGKRTTPKPFVVACDVFVHVENLGEIDDPPAQSPVSKTTPASSKNTEPVTELGNPMPLLLEAFQVAVQEDGWALLSTLGVVLRQLRPDFDPRTYGFKGLGLLVRAVPDVFALNEDGKHVRIIASTVDT